MQEFARRVSAFLLAQHLQPSTTAIYDVQASRRFAFTGTAALPHVSIVDQEAESRITGFGNENGIILRQHRTDTQWTFQLLASRCWGYDFVSGKPYLGMTRDAFLQIYDYEHGRFFPFRM